MAKRLFIALELPDSIRRLLAVLDPKVKGLRWLPREQLHATISFIDRVNSDQEQQLREALAEVRVPSFFLPIQGVGTFGGSRPTVVWAGLGKAHPHLFALHKHTQDAVLHAGLEPDLRPFHPHITLGRHDWLTIFKQAFSQMRQAQAAEVSNFSTPPASPTSASAKAAYLGAYKNDFFGEIAIVEQDGGLAIVQGPKKMAFPMTHWDRDTFTYETQGENSVGKAGITFTIDAGGKAQRVLIENLNIHGEGIFDRLSDSN